METYKKNFLTNVLVQVNFAPILSIAEGVPSVFQDLIREKLPRAETSKKFSVVLTGPEVKQNSATTHWQFWSEDRTRVAALDSGSITYERTKYTSYASFKEELSYVLTAFESVYKPSIISRIGLRYINQIHLAGNPFDWDSYIHANLVAGLSTFGGDSSCIARLMSQMFLVHDDAKILFQYGIFNTEFPNRISKKEFVLDYDCFNEDECGFSVISSKVDHFNDIVCGLFEQSIGEKMRELLREAE